jgi:pyridoxamine 5'-phosphate oxidase
MNNSIADIRNEYTQRGIDENELDLNPFDQFNKWIAEAVAASIDEANAMTLSTRSDSGVSARIVLLKGLDDRGFTFYTNYNSKKGQEMEASPYVSLTFFWKELERQVRVQGRIEKTPVNDSDAYFAIRPRGSQIGAWVSAQSEPIPNREFLVQKQLELEQQFEGKQVPRPAHWGGYRVIPNYIEFWQGRPSRLHDRLAYSLDDTENWKIERLSP